MITQLLSTLVPQDPDQHWQLPVKASSFAAEHDALFTFVEWINYFFFFGIMGVLFYSVIRYRRKSEDQPPASTVTHHTVIEVTWTVVPLIVVMVIFALGWKGYSDMTVAPANSLQYEVKGKRWQWSFKHAQAILGLQEPWVDRDFWVPVNEPCQLTMSSEDVIHSFFVPAFRVKRDVLPGRYQTVWFKPTKLGKFHIFCTEYCGDSHSEMIGTVHVVTRQEWEKRPWENWTGVPETDGFTLFRNKCSACHTNDGTAKTGPSFKGLWGKEETMVDGRQVLVDAQYIEDSIRTPQKDVVAGGTWGSTSTMTPFNEAALDDEKIEWLVAYIKSIGPKKD